MAAVQLPRLSRAHTRQYLNRVKRHVCQNFIEIQESLSGLIDDMEDHDPWDYDSAVDLVDRALHTRHSSIVDVFLIRYRLIFLIEGVSAQMPEASVQQVSNFFSDVHDVQSSVMRTADELETVARELHARVEEYKEVAERLQMPVHQLRAQVQQLLVLDEDEDEDEDIDGGDQVDVVVGSPAALDGGDSDGEQTAEEDGYGEP